MGCANLLRAIGRRKLLAVTADMGLVRVACGFKSWRGEG